MILRMVMPPWPEDAPTLKHGSSHRVAERGVLLRDAGFVGTGVRAKNGDLGTVAAASGQWLPLRRRWQHVRCTPDCWRSYRVAQVGSLGPIPDPRAAK